jgi:PAS domain S-box-containing protein
MLGKTKSDASGMMRKVWVALAFVVVALAFIIPVIIGINEASSGDMLGAHTALWLAFIIGLVATLVAGGLTLFLHHGYNEGSDATRAMAVVHGSVDAIITMSEDGVIASFNPGAEKLFGWQAEEAIGQKINRFMPSPHSEDHDNYLKHYIDTGEKKIIGIGREVEVKRKDGTLVQVHLSVSEFFENGHRMFAGIAKDISELVRLRSEAITATAVIEGAIDSIITLSDKGVILTFNPGAEKVFGCTAKDMIGQKINNLMPSPHKEDHDAYLTTYINTGVKKVMGIGREVEAMRLDGSLVPVHLSVSEFFVDGERRFAGIAKDITELVASRKTASDNQQQIQAIFDRMQITVSDYRSFIEKVSAGDLTKVVSVEGDDDLAELGNHLNVMNKRLSSIVSDTAGASQQLLSSLSELENAANTQASGAAEQASAINETTTIIEELKTSAALTGDKAQQLGELAETTQAEGQKGTEAILNIIETMKTIRTKVEAIAESILALSEQTQQIGETTKSVSALAQQSKLLALNASIEAAKAGEAGKGFAVVASEVKNLAEQSQQATKQVQSILQDIQQATDRAVMVTEEGSKGVDEGILMVEETGGVVKNLSKVIKSSSTASQQIVASIGEQTLGIDQIATAMSEINKAMTQFVGSAEETKTTSTELGKVAKSLEDNVRIFKFEANEKLSED